MSGKELSELKQTIRKHDYFSAVLKLKNRGYLFEHALRVVPRKGTFFSASQLDSLKFGISGTDPDDISPEDAKKVLNFLTLTVNIFGLFGTSSILPYYFDHIISTDPMLGQNLSGFLEIVNNAIYRKLFRVWSVPRRLVRNAEEILSDQKKILAFCGYDPRRLHVPLDVIRVSYLQHATRSVWALKNFAQDVLNVPVAITENIPFKVTLVPSACSRLKSNLNKLGHDFFLGREIVDVSMYFRVSFGPMSISGFNAFLPGQSSYSVMKHILDLFTPFHLKYQVELILKSKDVPKIKWVLGDVHSRLGLSTLVTSEKYTGNLQVRWHRRDRGVCKIRTVKSLKLSER